MKLACVQMDVSFGEASSNLSTIIEHLEPLAKDGVELVLYPEAALTGYCAANRDEALRIALPEGGGDYVADLHAACQRLGTSAVVGFAERIGEAIYNSAAYVSSTGSPLFYRKTHLPFLGMDRFARPGDELPVWSSPQGRLAPLICFDLRFPEAARTQALAGAELLMLPTNWPEGAEASAGPISIARAAENRIFVATCNRVGSERGFRFIGQSKIIHPSGALLAAAGEAEEVIVAEIDLAEARAKRTVNRPGEYETDVFEPRRPDLYHLPDSPARERENPARQNGRLSNMGLQGSRVGN